MNILTEDMVFKLPKILKNLLLSNLIREQSEGKAKDSFFEHLRASIRTFRGMFIILFQYFKKYVRLIK